MGRAQETELTLDGSCRFTAWYERRHLNPRQLGGARTALYALSRVYQVMGLGLPAWPTPAPVQPPATSQLRGYAEHLARHRGNPKKTVHKRLDHIGKLFEHLTRHGKIWRTMTLMDWTFWKHAGIEPRVVGGACRDGFKNVSVQSRAFPMWVSAFGAQLRNGTPTGNITTNSMTRATELAPRVLSWCLQGQPQPLSLS
jgi:hypothetical protein